MLGSFESVRLSACMHRLDLSLYSHPKEFGGTGIRTHVNSVSAREKSPLSEAQRRPEPTTLHHTGQQAQRTTD